jgi:hypothetical protein
VDSGLIVLVLRIVHSSLSGRRINQTALLFDLFKATKARLVAPYNRERSERKFFWGETEHLFDSPPKIKSQLQKFFSVLLRQYYFQTDRH